MASLKFCGASVSRYGSTIGWNEQTTTFSCTVVEDADDGDFFLPPPVGTPIFFDHGNFHFRGLLQSWTENHSVGGHLYELKGVDPRQILEGTQIIVKAYRGPTLVKNVINAYGWSEAKYGFGGSLSNDTGMPYFRVYEALINCANDLNGVYGSALNYRGVFYSLDLSELPVPPLNYRIPENMNLLQLISEIASDGACDYLIELVPGTFTIKVRTVNRNLQLPLGTISQIVKGGYGVDLNEYSNGLEARNEVTSVFLVGGQREELLLRPQTSINTFWGFDFQGKPIIGTGIGPAHKANLNASPISHIVGDTSYLCTVLEMRCALAGYESWAAYMLKEKPQTAATLNMPVGNLPETGLEFPIDYVNTSFDQVKNSNEGYVGEQNYYSSQLYSFVKGYADDFYGKKYIVNLPFVLRYVETETGKVVTSYQTTDGGYLPEGSAPLGLPLLKEDQFKLADGRFEAFALVRNLVGADLSRLGDDCVITENGVYVKISVDQNFVELTPTTPGAIITLNNPIYRKGDGCGDLSSLAELLSLSVEDTKKIQASISSGSMSIKVHAEAINPFSCAIPLKSNIATYGPWFAQGAPGAVRFEQDQTLTPWNYGGVGFMNLAALAKVNQGVSQLQVMETGRARIAGEPKFSLGDQIVNGGPNVTGIDVSIDPNAGMAVNYSFATFTKPRQGYFSKDDYNRIQRLGRQNIEFRKGLRAALNVKIARQNVINGTYSWLARMSPAVTRQSPHNVFLATLEPNKFGRRRPFVSSMTLQEAIAGCGGQNDERWKKTAMMSLDGLFTPAQTELVTDSNSKKYLPNVTIPTITGPNVLNSRNLYKFNGKAINILSSGYTYQDVNVNKKDMGFNPRFVTLSGPIWVTGWGVGTGNKDDPLTWKTGPVDLVWNEARGVWGCHDIMSGISEGPIDCNSSGIIKLTANGELTGGQQIAFNRFKTKINPGVAVFIAYNVNDNTWCVISCDC